MLIEKLERLVDAFENKGHAVRSNLAPGATEAELDALADRYTVELPPDFRELYTWHNGHIDQESWKTTLQFRDGPFIGIDLFEYPQSTINIWRDATEDGIWSDVLDLNTCVPFAYSNGDLLVVPGVGTSITPLSPRPVVAIGFGNLAVYFLSIETMIDTCIEWFEQPDWDLVKETPNELAIWTKHNPGVFPHHE